MSQSQAANITVKIRLEVEKTQRIRQDHEIQRIQKDQRKKNQL